MILCPLFPRLKSSLFIKHFGESVKRRSKVIKKLLLEKNCPAEIEWIVALMTHEGHQQGGFGKGG